MFVLALRPAVAATVLALAASLAAAAPAAAHDSEYCEHSSVHGRNWNVVYDGWWNEQGTSVDNGRDYHYHAVNHNYRQQAGSGPYYHYHRRPHYCGMTSGQQSRMAISGHSPVGVDFDVPVDAPVQVKSGEKVQYASHQVNALAATGRLSIASLYLTGNPFVPVGSRRVGSVPTGACVVAVFERQATGRLVAEVATADLAERLGHPC